MAGKWKKRITRSSLRIVLYTVLTFCLISAQLNPLISRAAHPVASAISMQHVQSVQIREPRPAAHPVASAISTQSVQSAQIREPKPSELYARSAVLMDADTGRILFEKNAHEAMPMASTTKIMTCILALENGNLQAPVSVSSNASAQPEVRLGMQEGEIFSLEDLLYSLMLESHNDSAVAIAEHLSGSVPAFAEFMNKKAEEIGCEDTYFITPNGLDAQDENGIHHTTSADLARIMRYCIVDSPKQKEFLRITQTDQHTFSNTDGSRTFACYNHNTFLKMMEGALTGKTGFTGDAGYCYVGALRSDERTYIAALLACGWPNNRSYKWHDMKCLMEYGLEQFYIESVQTENAQMDLEVTGGMPTAGNSPGTGKSTVHVKAKEQPGSVQVLMCEGEEVIRKADVPEVLNAPVYKGDVIGSVSYFLDGMELLTVPVVLCETSEKRTLSRCGIYILSSFLLQNNG